MACAFAFHAMWALDNDAFSGNLGEAQFGLLYFSYVTLATLGYGDIVPVGQVARSVAMVEALMGQIFLVTLVAALVGNLGRCSAQDRTATSPRVLDVERSSSRSTGRSRSAHRVEASPSSVLQGAERPW